ncbi:hypothetical protein PYCCODRAFT_1439075 [Trametes coccinea BRFM310]|uniref:Uncharacterized protein n=1 Tax=Trametes coccinea (strain BRFM310) TaxID=1353009 RepID=A0A1Y2IBU2_TRAC3|nr:hypothetical protein PYCCODRAFT_1439075 [Trametes coccinea BRFM310]
MLFRLEVLVFVVLLASVGPASVSAAPMINGDLAASMVGGSERREDVYVEPSWL